jgi:hypothetical protein
MLAMFWQALLWLTPIGQSQQAVDLANLMAHTQSLDHHHHDDQSLHVDDSADSQSQHHVHVDAQPAGLLPASLAQTVLKSPGSLPITHVVHWVSAWLQGPLRPPQTTA